MNFKLHTAIRIHSAHKDHDYTSLIFSLILSTFFLNGKTIWKTEDVIDSLIADSISFLKMQVIQIII